MSAARHLLVPLLFALGCGDPSSPDGTRAPGFTLSVDSARYAWSVSGVRPDSGNHFLVVQATLENTGSQAPLALSPERFTVRSTKALVFSASPLTASLKNPCRADVAVASGGTASCEVVFSMPESEVPEKLVYLAGYEQQSAAVPTPEAPKDPCAAVAGWTRWETQPCSDCGNAHCSEEAKAILTGCTLAELEAFDGCPGGLYDCDCIAASSVACSTVIVAVQACQVENCKDLCE